MAKNAERGFVVSGGTLKAEPIELVAAGPESVLGYFHVAAQRPGAAIDQHGLQRLTIRDGKIAALQNLFTDDDEIVAFFEGQTI